MNQVKKSVQENKKIVWLILLLLLGFFIYGYFINNYHKKEIKALKSEITIVQDQFEEAINEKERFKDSSIIYELLAEQAKDDVNIFKAKAAKERKAKEEALAALYNLPKDVIDTFFINRYINIAKSDIGLEIDKNTGNEIIIELVEKDHLVNKLATTENLNNTLDAQVKVLENSLIFSKTSLSHADSAINYKTKQFELSQQANNLLVGELFILKKDLKIAKSKVFWNKFIKGAGVSIAASILVSLLSK